MTFLLDVDIICIHSSLLMSVIHPLMWVVYMYMSALMALSGQLMDPIVEETCLIDYIPNYGVSAHDMTPRKAHAGPTTQGPRQHTHTPTLISLKHNVWTQDAYNIDKL